MLNLKSKLDFKITKVELYKYNVTAERHFSFGTWTSRQHAFIKIESDGAHGYGENIISTNCPEVSLEEWGGGLRKLVGLSVEEALNLIPRKYDMWSIRCCEMAEMALIDLAGKLLKQPALEILNLSCKEPVHGVYVILSDDIDYVEKEAKWAYENMRARYIKVKLFGDLELDKKIIKAVRKNTDKRTYLIGDVNTGYGQNVKEEELNSIADSLKELYESGLDACEDPADMSNDMWRLLQKNVDKLSLIPDEPMRPARVVINQDIYGMGDIYNIHPGCMGSIIDAVALAKKIKRLGSKLMIGDDSLIGPACTVWQQLAIGLGANWVEALEKKDDSDNFMNAIENIATKINTNGAISIDKKMYGFGLELNANKLIEGAAEVIVYN